MKLLAVLVCFALVFVSHAVIPFVPTNSQFYCLQRHSACQLTNNCYADPSQQPKIRLQDILTATGISYFDFLMMNRQMGALPQDAFDGNYSICVSGMWQGSVSG